MRNSFAPLGIEKDEGDVDDDLMCGICDDRREWEEEEMRTEMWPGLGEEVHTESCPHRLVNSSWLSMKF